MTTTQHWRTGGIEPTVQDLMSDPIMALMLRHDRITPDDVWAAIRGARRTRRARAA